MLLGGKQAEINQVAVVTRNQQFNRLLGSILADWKFFVVEDLCAAEVIFAERGLELPEHSGKVVWLTPLPLWEGDFLLVPISLTRLYHLLEVHFFPTPRRHIRVPMDLSADIKVGQNWQEGRLTSLSDRGGRVATTQEITSGAAVLIDMRLGGMSLRMPAEVLYSIPAGDSPGRTQPQIGVLFRPADDKMTETLRFFIERISIDSACARENIKLADPCVSWLDVPANPWGSSR